MSIFGRQNDMKKRSRVQIYRNRETYRHAAVQIVLIYIHTDIQIDKLQDTDGRKDRKGNTVAS